MSIFTKRRSIRKYDESFKISKKELNEILSLTLKAPSSMNLQPTRLFVVESNEAKDLVRPSMKGNLLQLDTSSAFIIIATDLNKFEKGIQLFDKANQLGFLPDDVAKRQKDIIKVRNNAYIETQILNEGYLDAGLLAMQLMLVAKEFGYDTCAIAGIDKNTILKNLGVNDDNIKPVLAVSLGKALDEGFASYRYDVKDVTEFY